VEHPRSFFTLREETLTARETRLISELCSTIHVELAHAIEEGRQDYLIESGRKSGRMVLAKAV
jgi:hypothetical protein